MSVSQHWEKEKYEKNARFVSDYGEELIEWLNPQKNEYIYWIWAVETEY